jgi:hypothetical protein
MAWSRACAAALAVAAAGGGCSAGNGGSVDVAGFVAQNVDFRGYQSWTSFTMEASAPGGSTHVAGKRTVYINHLPPPGATEFPVGTIIVKETEADGQIFARAKRGESYNETGAVNWEWFELETKQGVTGIHWRGKGPPSGETYGGDPNAGCNLCHKLAPANDYVLTPALTLAGAPDGGAGGAPDAPQDGSEDGADDAARE